MSARYRLMASTVSDADGRSHFTGLCAGARAATTRPLSVKLAPNVPDIEENRPGEEPRSLRARLEMHRRNPTCASCHRVMDPLGFALENFDGIGEYRVKEVGGAIDPSGQLADGAPIDGPVALRRALLNKPEMFVRTLTQKLMMYALGRELVRAVGGAAEEDAELPLGPRRGHELHRDRGLRELHARVRGRQGAAAARGTDRLGSG